MNGETGTLGSKMLKRMYRNNTRVKGCDQEGEPTVSTVLNKDILSTYYVLTTGQSSEDSVKTAGLLC